MLKVLLSFAFAAMVLAGCSQQGNPVNGDLQSGEAASQHDNMITPVMTGAETTATTLFVALPDYNAVEGSTEVTQFVTVAAGGNIKLNVKYLKQGETKASISATIKFQPGTLTQDQNITVRLDPTTLGFEFLPHGITFDKPALLTIDVDGLDLTNFEQGTDLWYVENGQFTESYQAAKIKLDIPKCMLTAKDIALRHFSQYVFGRMY